MSAGKSYVLDANVFIEAHQTYYGFDICPGFWQALVRQHEAKRVFSIDKIKAELVAMADRLKDWAQKKVPIPNVCVEFEVEYCNTFEMLKDLKEQFVLSHGGRRTG